jgi:hypothetical protein
VAAERRRQAYRQPDFAEQKRRRLSLTQHGSPGHVPIESDRALDIANDTLAAFSGLVPVRHPFGEELNPGLRPGTFSSRRRGRHYGPADATNPVVDGRGVCFHVVVICEIERLAHGVNIPLCEERANVRLKARLCRHNSKNLKDAETGPSGKSITGADREPAGHNAVQWPREIYVNIPL